MRRSERAIVYALVTWVATIIAFMGFFGMSSAAVALGITAGFPVSWLGFAIGFEWSYGGRAKHG